jgi:formylglycine-generating enzyme required for sulfatase activity
MKKLCAVGGAAIFIIIGTVTLFYLRSDQRAERLHYEHEETELIISNIPDARLTLFKAESNLQDALAITVINGERTWLPRGNYFLKVEQSARTFLYPIPIVGYLAGPEKGGTFTVTIRPPGTDSPQGLFPDLPDYVFVPGGHFLFGDHLRVQEPHYVWLGGFFISPFEVTNAEFKEFLVDPRGYLNDTNWTEAGRKWKAANTSHATALLRPTDTDYQRFGQPDQPVVQVNWFEANAFCHWLTKIIGKENGSSLYQRKRNGKRLRADRIISITDWA